MHGTLTVVTQGTAPDTSHAAAREAAKMRDFGLEILKSSDIYIDKGGQFAVDLEWRDDPKRTEPTSPAEDFRGRIAQLSQPHPESAGKELVNEAKASEESEEAPEKPKTTARKGGARAKPAKRAKSKR